MTIEPTLQQVEPSLQQDLKTSILLDSRNFLISVQVGASHEYLTSLLLEIRKQEATLMKNERLMLHPCFWRILVNRLANRKHYEVIDNVSSPPEGLV